MTTPPAPAPAPANAAAAAARSSRTRWLVSAIVVLVMAVGGALAGRMLRPATPSLPTAYPVLPATSVTARDGSVSPVTAQAPLPTGYAVQPAAYAAAGAPPQPVAVGGGMTIGAGRPVCGSFAVCAAWSAAQVCATIPSTSWRLGSARARGSRRMLAGVEAMRGVRRSLNPFRAPRPGTRKSGVRAPMAGGRRLRC